MKVKLRKINLTFFCFWKNLIFFLTKILGIFPFEYDRESNCFVYSEGLLAYYTVGCVFFQGCSTLIVLWITFRRISGPAVFKELAHLSYLLGVFIYHASVILLFWNLHKKWKVYLKVLNDINFVRLGLEKINKNTRVDHRYEYMFAVIAFSINASIMTSIVFFGQSLDRAGHLEGIGAIELVSMVFVAPAISNFHVIWLSVNLAVAHCLNVMRINLGVLQAKVKREELSQFQFEIKCLEFCDVIDHMAMLEDKLYSSVLLFLKQLDTSLGLGLLNYFLGFIANVLKVYVCYYFYFQGRAKANYGDIECILSIVIILYCISSAVTMLYGPSRVEAERKLLLLSFESFEKPLTEERLEASVELFMIQVQHQQNHPISNLNMMVLDMKLGLKAAKSCVAYLTVMVQFSLYSQDSQ